MPPTSTYSPEVAQQICDRLADGEFLRVICRSEGMPNWRTVYRWIQEYPEFATHIARARDLGFDAIAEDTIIDIADLTQIGVKTVDKPTGTEVSTSDMIEHRKLRIETRLKMLAKWSPKKYGDKQEITHKVEDDTTARLLSGRSRTGG